MRREHTWLQPVRGGLTACLWLASACTGVHELQVEADPADPGSAAARDPGAAAAGDARGNAAPAARGERGGSAPVAGESPSESPIREPAVQAPAPLLLLESAGALQVMDGTDIVAELPGLSEPLPPDAYAVTQLVAGPKFALIVHRIERPWDAAPILDPAQPPAGSFETAMLVRRSDWQVLWRRRSDLFSGWRGPLLGLHGQAVFEKYPADGSPASTRVVALDGQENAVEHVVPLSGPDADGWFAAQLTTGTQTWAEYTFARAGEAAPRRLSAPLHLPSAANESRIDPTPLVRADGSLHYVTGDGAAGELALVHERPDAVQRVALGRPPHGDVRLLSGESAWLLTSIDAAPFAERPWVAVDDMGEVRALTVPDEHEVSYVSAAHGDWFGVWYEQEHEPRGWIDAATSEWRPMPQPPAGMRPFATDYCRSASMILDQDRVLVGLRDDASGGMFIDDGTGELTRIGALFRDATHLETTRAGDTFQLHAVAFGYSYCQQPSWPAPAPEVEQLLRGGQRQLVRGERSLVVDHEHGDVSLLAPDGHRALVTRGETVVLHDLVDGGARELPEGTRVVGWF